MESLVGKRAVMAVNLPNKKLYTEDRVEILGWWKVLSPIDGDGCEKRTQLRIRSLVRPNIEEDVDFADILIKE